MKKIIIFLLIILFFTKTQNVFGNTKVFTVDNIEVDGKSSEKNYRKKSIQVAFRTGFQKLIKNIIRKEQQRELLSTDLETINSLISSYRILEETVLQDTYNIKYLVKFNRSSVEKFLRNKNVSYSQIKKLNIIIYPILVNNSELQVFSKNKFFEEWNKEENFENINFILPVENLDDLNFIRNNIDDLEEINMSKLVDNYEIKNSAILILRYDENKLNIFLKTKLFNTTKVKKIDFNLDDMNKIEARSDIILKLKNYIHELWKEENLIDISAPSYLTVNTSIQDNSSLTKIIQRIKNISLIDNYTIEEISNESVKIKIKFFGKIKNLKDGFESNGIEIKIIHNEWNLYLNT